MTRQLSLDLALPPRFGREDFLLAPSNAAAVATLDRWPAWPDPVLILIGPEGSGKTHLATIWAAAAGARVLAAPEPGQVDRDTAMLIEDADRLEDREADLFHLLNTVRDAGGSLLLTARTAPDHWGLRTADLVSRLRLAPAVRIGAPDDDLMRAVLVKLFADRQLVTDESVIGYLVSHLDRSLGAARIAVDALDRTALALNRRVTRPMTITVVERLASTTD